MKKRILGLVTMLAIFSMFIPVIHAETIASGNCGAYNSETREYADNVTWTLSDTGVLNITGSGEMYKSARKPWAQYSSQIKSVTIGQGVTTIADNAFSACNNITSVYIQSNVLTEIGDSAFNSCHLSGVSLPAGLLKIGKNAFMSNWFSGTVNIPASVTEIGAGAFTSLYAFTLSVNEGNENYVCVDGVIFNKDMTELVAYSGAKVNTADDGIYTVPETVTSIAGQAFYNNPKGLNGIVLPEGLTAIGDEAFHSAGLKTSLTIPKNVSAIGKDAFLSLSVGKGIEVDEDNQYYSSEDNALLDKNKTKLISYRGDALMYSVPESVRTIEDNAFNLVRTLQMIDIPEGVTSIGENAFQACGALKYVSLPKSLETLGPNAFTFSSKLDSVYYAGSEEEWSQLAGDQYGLTADTKYNASGIPNKIFDTTSVTAGEGTYTFNVNMMAAEDCELITVLYSGNLVKGVKSEHIAAGTTEKTVEVTCDSADNAKVFLWNSMDGIKPLCDIREIAEASFN